MLSFAMAAYSLGLDLQQQSSAHHFLREGRVASIAANVVHE